MSSSAHRFFIRTRPQAAGRARCTGGVSCYVSGAASVRNVATASMPSATAPTARAFTLIEVVLSIGLFVIAAGILSGSLYSGMQAYRAARNDAQIENRYRLALREVMAISARDEFDRSGTVRLPDGGTARWEADLEQSGLVDLFTAQVVIRLDSGSGSNGFVLSEEEARRGRTFELALYRPSWSDVTERSSLLDDRRSALERRRDGR